MSSIEAHLLLKAAATATDQGSFTAIAAAYTLDRDGERIRPGAFANTIKAWQDRDRPIPLHWAHKGNPENVIGEVDPHSMKETDDGLYVEGKLDLEGSDLAKEAWRLVKADTVSLSFGFLGEVTPKAKDGTREIVDIDLYEVSLTPAPANPDTHFLSIKSVKELVSDLRAQLDEAGTGRFAADKDTYVYVEDFDPDEGWAVFSVSSQGSYKYFKVSYTKQTEGVELTEGETEVERITRYLPRGSKQAEETDGPAEVPDVVDPLRKQLADLELEFSSRDFEALQPPPKVEVKELDGQPDLAELQRRYHDLMLDVLSEGVETT